MNPKQKPTYNKSGFVGSSAFMRALKQISSVRTACNTLVRANARILKRLESLEENKVFLENKVCAQSKRLVKLESQMDHIIDYIAVGGSLRAVLKSDER